LLFNWRRRREAGLTREKSEIFVGDSLKPKSLGLRIAAFTIMFDRRVFVFVHRGFSRKLCLMPPEIVFDNQRPLSKALLEYAQSNERHKRFLMKK
jgi:hypothetical protein